MIYLLDTNVWVVLLRSKSAVVDARFRVEAAAGTVRSCSVVAAELRHGAFRSAKPAENRAAVDTILAPFPSVPFDDDAAEHYAEIRHHLEQIGQPIGPLDLQIAAIARHHGWTVVTHNLGEFSRVPGLHCEVWQSP
ncbi:type II toxin-antitoxin system toxin VapC [soil metagenome]